MKDFLNLNKQKIIFWTKILFISIGLLGLLFSVVVALTNNLESGLECMLYSILFDICFVAIIVPLAIILDYFFIFKKRLDYLNNQCLQHFFIKNQFTKTIINKENKYQLTHYEMQGKIEEFTVRTYTAHNHFNKFFFNFKVDIIPIEKEHYKSLAKIFKELNAMFDFEGILVEIEIDKTLSDENITKKLYAFADVLKTENIKPTFE